MYFEIRKLKRPNATYVYAYPFIKYGDSDLGRLQELARLLGGKVNPHNIRNYQWYVMSQKAVDLARMCKEYAPSRTGIIAAIELWESCDIDERLILAEEVIKNYPFTPTTKADYLMLARSPQFLAGVLDARGVFYMQESFDDSNDKSWGWNRLRMHLSTTNIGLAEALRETYGGHLAIEVNKGDIRDFGGRTSIAQKDSIRWSVGASTCEQLMTLTRQYRRLQQPNA